MQSSMANRDYEGGVSQGSTQFIPDTKYVGAGTEDMTVQMQEQVESSRKSESELFTPEKIREILNPEWEVIFDDALGSVHIFKTTLDTLSDNFYNLLLSPKDSIEYNGEYYFAVEESQYTDIECGQSSNYRLLDREGLNTRLRGGFSLLLNSQPQQNYPSKNYVSKLVERFDKGSLEAKIMLLKYVTKSSVVSGTLECGEDRTCMGYLISENKIYINYNDDYLDDRGIGVPFFHEIGHLVDYNAGFIVDRSISKSSDYDNGEFENLLKKDFYTKVHLEAEQLKSAKQNATFSTDPNDIFNSISWRDYTISTIYNELFDRISDIFESDSPLHSAVSDMYNGMSFVSVGGYIYNIKSPYAHDPHYWKKSNRLSTEAAAHFFEAQFDNERKEVLKKYFPQATIFFDKMLLQMVRDYGVANSQNQNKEQQ